jgi:hypothetical protein
MEQAKDADFVMMAMAFPGLRDAAGINPWNPNQLDIWAAEEADEPGAIVAAQYLLSLWNPGCQWQCGAFDPHYAIKVWGGSHRRGFLELASRDATPN